MKRNEHIVKIRRAKKTDFKKIAEIHAKSWKDSYPGILPAEFLSDKLTKEFEKHWSEIQIQEQDVVLVAEENNLVGFIAVWCQPIPFIDNLHVIPSQRSKKTGSALMKAVAEELINTGQRKAFLWVFEDNKKAIKFYIRLGGIQKEKSMKNVFGYDIPSQKIEWDDISTILEIIS